MKCRHCHSTMHVYQSASTDRCEVQFYRCSICSAEYVSSNPLQQHSPNSHSRNFSAVSRLSSQNPVTAPHISNFMY